MNISAVNCSPIKPQSFGMAQDINEVRKMLDTSKELGDIYSKTDDDGITQKTPLGSFLSGAVAVFATFVGGKIVANKALTPCPNLPDKIYNGLKTGADFVRTYADDIAINGGKVSGTVANGVSKLQRNARQVFKQVTAGKNFGDVLSTAVGIGSLVTLAPDILTVDGNKDGKADITQKGSQKVNAYANAITSIDLISSVM